MQVSLSVSHSSAKDKDKIQMTKSIFSLFIIYFFVVFRFFYHILRSYKINNSKDREIYAIIFNAR